MIEIINTGGTFNKRYNPISGILEVPTDFLAVEDILKKSLYQKEFKITQIISKDSLEFNKKDRKLLLKTIYNSKSNKIIVIHGTDTMKKSAKFISKFIKNKVVVFTGAMKPYEIEKIEAISNLMQGIGFIQNSKNGVFISMHGIINKWDRVEKNYNKGIFYEK